MQDAPEAQNTEAKVPSVRVSSVRLVHLLPHHESTAKKPGIITCPNRPRSGKMLLRKQLAYIVIIMIVVVPLNFCTNDTLESHMHSPVYIHMKNLFIMGTN